MTGRGDALEKPAILLVLCKNKTLVSCIPDMFIKSLALDVMIFFWQFQQIESSKRVIVGKNQYCDKQFLVHAESIGIIAATIHNFSLNRNDETTDNKKHEQAAQGSGHQHLRRAVRRPTADAPGEDRNDGRGIGKCKRDSQTNAICVGIRNKSTLNRSTSTTCRSPRNQGSYSLAARVNSDSASPYLTLIFQDSGKTAFIFTPVFLGQRNSAKFSTLIFQDPNGFSKRIFNKIAEICIFSIGKRRTLHYNTRIPLGCSGLALRPTAGKADRFAPLITRQKPSLTKQCHREPALVRGGFFTATP